MTIVSIFHYHAVKRAEDEIFVTFAITHDHIRYTEPTVTVTIRKSDGHRIEAIETPNFPDSEPLRARLASWLAFCVLKSIRTAGTVEDEYWHTA